MNRPSRGLSWDYALMMLTVAALAALGVQSFVGTLYAWWAANNVAAWETVGYTRFIDAMNAIAAPVVIALVVLLGLCIPKRVLARRALAAASAALVLTGLIAWAVSGDPAVGLAVYLLAAAVFQVIVLAMTMGDSSALSYLTEGHLVRIGSGLLHLGFVLFAYVVVALQDSRWMFPVFWMASGLLAGGSALSFYAGSLTRRRAESPTVP